MPSTTICASPYRAESSLSSWFPIQAPAHVRPPLNGKRRRPAEEIGRDDDEQCLPKKRQATEDDIFANLEHLSLDATTPHIPYSSDALQETNTHSPLSTADLCNGQAGPSGSLEHRMVLYRPKAFGGLEYPPLSEYLSPGKLEPYSALACLIPHIPPGSIIAKRSHILITHPDCSDIETTQNSSPKIVELPDDFDEASMDEMKDCALNDEWLALEIEAESCEAMDLD